MNDLFHSLITRWFQQTFGSPTAPQSAGWARIAAGQDTLIAAPTGSGKTLAAFLWAIDGLVRAAASDTLQDCTGVVYVSPLKALGSDIQKNLQGPLQGITALAAAAGLALREIRVLVRTGDTPAVERARMIRRPPHILITTPESLYILLTAESSRRYLAAVHTVIVDEIHAVAGDKRGPHLALSLERLDALAGRRLQRIGLSATQQPIDEIARLLVGAGRSRPDGAPDCAIVDMGHRRDLDLRIELPDQPLTHVATHELRQAIYDRIAALARTHRSTIVFVNTRRLVERVAHQLTMRLGEGKVEAHHGSLSRRTRLAAEMRLKTGDLPVIVATASLELGIDIGAVDLVCHLGAPRAIATLLQRVGRSGHWLGATPKGILFPLTRDELVQCAAAIRAVRRGILDQVTIPDAPLDILAQQIVAITATGEIEEQALWELVRRAYPYHALPRCDFEAMIEMLSEGVSSRRGRMGAHLHRDRVHGCLKGRRGARLAAITGGGAIPDTADYDVIEEPTGTFVGKVNEDFAVESLAGDIFLLGNHSWRIRRIEAGRVRVEDAQGAPPNIPFWLGESPGRTIEISQAVAELREAVAQRLPDVEAASAWLTNEAGLDRDDAGQLIAYIAETIAVLGTVPTQTQVVVERFFDESGGMQLILHAPFGGRINRALGLLLRKRFCRRFDFELQAAATDDGIVLSLGEQHAFPLESIFGLLSPHGFRDDLIQAILQSPIFINRWRWNATRALALLRHSGGRRVPMPIQRMRAEDLLAAAFPAQVACQDNHLGPVELPDHPLVRETIKDCLHEAMDLDGLLAVVRAIEEGTIRTVSVDTPAPSPMCHEILNANPYAFLDDAPLEERRARAVALRRIDPDLQRGIGALDQSAIDEVCRQAWPDVRDADELHDLLLSVGILPIESAREWSAWADRLMTDGRAVRVRWTIAHPTPGAASSAPTNRFGIVGAGLALPEWGAASSAPTDQMVALVATERIPLVRAAIPHVCFEPDAAPAFLAGGAIGHPDRIEATRAILNGWLEILGPTTAPELAARLGLDLSKVEAALLALEADGVALRGRFRPGASAEPIEWCERRLLARIHRLTIGRLRREIEAVPVADFVRFLLRWQHVASRTQLHGREGIAEVIGQLQGLELPAHAWERDILPARIALYNPDELEALCLSGEVAWGRLRLAPESVECETENGEGMHHARSRPQRRRVPTRAAPLALVLRADLPLLLEPGPAGLETIADLSPLARRVVAYLQQRGASFLADIARAVGLLAPQAEEALWELVARGLVTGDGIAGLRLLLKPQEARRLPHRRVRAIRGGLLREHLIPVGRWSLLRDTQTVHPTKEQIVEAMARQRLRRYGVVTRELLMREGRAPSWRELLQVYWRLEARGEIRGGRFIAGLVGEQFALPQAVEALRAVRRQPALSPAEGSDDPETVIVGAADPLNLLGILLPGPRLSPFSGKVVAYRAGVPVAVGELGAVRSELQSSLAVR
ncbi:MAG: DEAD/DEAH box helicase [Candidatus Methylomirabilota bacterium]|nr:MAG: DEAD/DEAH box helicase [candidate division NC10 bacterium]